VKTPNAASLVLAGLFAATTALVPNATVAAEPPPLPKDFPAFGADQPLPVPAIAKSTLPNGLTVWFVKRPAFPKVSIVIAVRGGTVAGAVSNSATPQSPQGKGTLPKGPWVLVGA